MNADTEAANPDELRRVIYLIRGHRVMLDEDLARIYGVSTKRLNEQVTRNAARFPGDFCFRLDAEEFQLLRSQIATSSWGGRRHMPRAFREHGAVMLASVLNSPIAVDASIRVVRAFIRLRELLTSHDDLSRKLEDLERKLVEHDKDFESVFDAIRQLMGSTDPPDHRRIGFQGT